VFVNQAIVVETHLKKVADGDTAAVHEVLNRYGGLVWSLARRLSQNEADAEDAVQEVFIDVWRNAARFDPALASEATFITLLARRRLIDRHRKRTRRVVTTPLDETISQSSAVAADTADFESQTEVSEEALRAKEQMQRLRPEEQRVLELSVIKVSRKVRLPRR